jgi:hypothetical protein
LQGKKLAILGWHHRHGKLQLTLVLPDGTKSFIPAAWTDLDTGKAQDHQFTDKQSTARVLGSIFHLLHARKIVDALLCKLDSSEQVQGNVLKGENKRATTTRTLEQGGKITYDARYLGRLGPTGSKNRTRSTGKIDQQGSSYKSQRQYSGEEK